MPWERDYEEEAGQASLPAATPTEAAIFDVFGLPIQVSPRVPDELNTREEDKLKVS